MIQEESKKRRGMNFASFVLVFGLLINQVVDEIYVKDQEESDSIR